MNIIQAITQSQAYQSCLPLSVTICHKPPYSIHTPHRVLSAPHRALTTTQNTCSAARKIHCPKQSHSTAQNNPTTAYKFYNTAPLPTPRNHTNYIPTYNNTVVIEKHRHTFCITDSKLSLTKTYQSCLPLSVTICHKPPYSIHTPHRVFSAPHKALTTTQNTCSAAQKIHCPKQSHSTAHNNPTTAYKLYSTAPLPTPRNHTNYIPLPSISKPHRLIYVNYLHIFSKQVISYT